MTISVIFKSPLPSFTYLYKNGMSAVFMNGRYSTSVESQIRELMEEVGEVGKTKSRHPYIFIDENEAELDSEALSPMELIKLQAKEEARKELLEEQAREKARAMNASENVSNTTQGDFAASLGNSNTIAQEGSAESTGDNVSVGTASSAKLANLATTFKAAK